MDLSVETKSKICHQVKDGKLVSFEGRTKTIFDTDFLSGSLEIGNGWAFPTIPKKQERGSQIVRLSQATLATRESLDLTIFEGNNDTGEATFVCRTDQVGREPIMVAIGTGQNGQRIIEGLVPITRETQLDIAYGPRVSGRLDVTIN